MGNPKTDRKMDDFRMFCKLIAKTMLKAIDFTDVVEVYRRNEKPEILGIATLHCTAQMSSPLFVEMKSPRYWALQQTLKEVLSMMNCRNENPEIIQQRDVKRESLTKENLFLGKGLEQRI